MKVSYTCEVCGKVFSTQQEALECEKKHLVETDEMKRRRDELKKKSNDVISKLYNQHIREFNELPDVIIDKELEGFVDRIISKNMEEFFDIIEQKLKGE